MAITKWKFKNVSFELNPFQDSGWTKELKIAEVELIDSDTTVIQTSGAKSRVRRIRGWINTSATLNQWWNWFGQEGELVDDNLTKLNCKLVSFVPERIFDIKNWERRRYTAIFVER